jgi:hypothetical protein
MFRVYVLIIRRSKLHYTASGIITCIGGRHVHATAIYTCDDTRGCVMQFWSPDDEHMCSKHVEEWNKLTVKQKFCASSWLITEIKYTEMHGQQNVKISQCYFSFLMWNGAGICAKAMRIYFIWNYYPLLEGGIRPQNILYPRLTIWP